MVSGHTCSEGTGLGSTLKVVIHISQNTMYRGGEQPGQHWAYWFYHNSSTFFRWHWCCTKSVSRRFASRFPSVSKCETFIAALEWLIDIPTYRQTYIQTDKIHAHHVYVGFAQDHDLQCRAWFWMVKHQHVWLIFIDTLVTIHGKIWIGKKLPNMEAICRFYSPLIFPSFNYTHAHIHTHNILLLHFPTHGRIHKTFQTRLSSF